MYKIDFILVYLTRDFDCSFLKDFTVCKNMYKLIKKVLLNSLGTGEKAVE